MKKRIRILILILIISLTSIVILLINLKNLKKSSSIISHFDIILGEKCNKKSFLISVDDLDYYLDGYNVENSFVIINENGKTIREEDIKLAIEKIKSNIFSYKEDDNNFRIYKMKEALYNFVIDASWLKKYSYISKIETKGIVDKIEIEKKMNSKKEEFIDKVNHQKLVLNQLDVSLKMNDSPVFINIQDFINKEYKFDYLINRISKVYSLLMVNAKGKYTSNELRIYEINDYKIGIEYGFKDDYMIYHIYLIDN